MSYPPPSDPYRPPDGPLPPGQGQPFPASPQPYSPQPYSAQPYNPGPYGYGPPQPMFVVPARPSSTAAVWALVLGLVGFFAGWCMLGIPCLAAVIVGHVAVADTRNDKKSGRGMAIAGLALGYVSLAPAVILFFWLVLGSGASSLLPTVGVSPTP